MSLIAFALALQDSAPGMLLRAASAPVILAIQIGHVVGLILLLSTLLLLNLRLLGRGLASQPAAQLAQASRPYLGTGLVLTLVSGCLLYLSAPVSYIANAAFVPKMALLLLALAVQLGLHRGVIRRATPAPPLLARASAVLSLALWLGVGMAGRAIGFV